VPLQALPSAHAEPFGSDGFWQPVTGLQLFAVHGLPSLQLSGAPAVQVPDWHVSSPLQTVLSAHDVPFGNGLVVQPKTGSQPSVVHGLPSLQVSGVPGVQVPAWQVSLPLHRLPSVHDVPLGTAGCWHPLTGWQLSAVHALPSLQTSGAPLAQEPLWHVSSPLQTLPSLHDEPLDNAVCWQPPTGSQLSVVHGFESLQARGEPVVHEPL
jgi:hypothetical protein